MLKKVLVILCAVMVVFEGCAMEDSQHRNPFRLSPEAWRQFFSQMANGYRFVSQRKIPISGSSLVGALIVYNSLRGNNQNSIGAWYNGLSSAIAPTGLVYILLHLYTKVDELKKGQEELKDGQEKIKERVGQAEENLGKKIDGSAEEQKKQLNEVSRDLGNKIDKQAEEQKQQNELILARVGELAQQFTDAVSQAEKQDNYTNEQLDKLQERMKALRELQGGLSDGLREDIEKQYATILATGEQSLNSFKEEVAKRMDESEENAQKRHSDLSGQMDTVNDNVGDLRKGQKEEEKKRVESDKKNGKRFDALKQQLDTTNKKISDSSKSAFWRDQNSRYGNEDEIAQLEKIFSNRPQMLAKIKACKENMEQYIPARNFLKKLEEFRSGYAGKDALPDEVGTEKMWDDALIDNHGEQLDRIEKKLSKLAMPGAPVIVSSQGSPDSLLTPAIPPSSSSFSASAYISLSPKKKQKEKDEPQSCFQLPKASGNLRDFKQPALLNAITMGSSSQFAITYQPSLTPN